MPTVTLECLLVAASALGIDVLPWMETMEGDDQLTLALCKQEVLDCYVAHVALSNHLRAAGHLVPPALSLTSLKKAYQCLLEAVPAEGDRLAPTFRLGTSPLPTILDACQATLGSDGSVACVRRASDEELKARTMEVFRLLSLPFVSKDLATETSRLPPWKPHVMYGFLEVSAPRCPMLNRYAMLFMTCCHNAHVLKMREVGTPSMLALLGPATTVLAYADLRKKEATNTLERLARLSLTAGMRDEHVWSSFWNNRLILAWCDQHSPSDFLRARSLAPPSTRAMLQAWVMHVCLDDQSALLQSMTIQFGRREFGWLLKIWRAAAGCLATTHDPSKVRHYRRLMRKVREVSGQRLTMAVVLDLHAQQADLWLVWNVVRRLGLERRNIIRYQEEQELITQRTIHRDALEQQVLHRSSLSQGQARWVLDALGFRTRPKTRLPYVMALVGLTLWGVWWVTVKLMSWLTQPGFLGWWPTLPCLALVALGGLAGWRTWYDQRVAHRWVVEQGHDDVGPRLEALMSGGPDSRDFEVLCQSFEPLPPSLPESVCPTNVLGDADDLTTGSSFSSVVA